MSTRPTELQFNSSLLSDYLLAFSYIQNSEAKTHSRKLSPLLSQTLVSLPFP